VKPNRSGAKTGSEGRMARYRNKLLTSSYSALSACQTMLYRPMSRQDITIDHKTIMPLCGSYCRWTGWY